MFKHFRRSGFQNFELRKFKFLLFVYIGFSRQNRRISEERGASE